MGCVKNNFLTQVFNKPTKGGSLLNLLFTNRFVTSLELVISSVKADGSFRSINDEMVKFKKWRDQTTISTTMKTSPAADTVHTSHSWLITVNVLATAHATTTPRKSCSYAPVLTADWAKGHLCCLKSLISWSPAVYGQIQGAAYRLLHPGLEDKDGGCRRTTAQQFSLLAALSPGSLEALPQSLLFCAGFT